MDDVRDQSEMLFWRIESDQSFIDALKEAREIRGHIQDEVEHCVGLTGGHLGKIENGDKKWGKFTLRLTMTAVWLLEFYGLSLIVVDKETARRLCGAVALHHKRRHLVKETQKERPMGKSLMMRWRRRPR